MHNSSRNDGQRKSREDFCQKNVVLCFHCVSIWAEYGSRTRLSSLGSSRTTDVLIPLLEPILGLEPRTYSLRMNCSTNWAISADMNICAYKCVAKVYFFFRRAKFIGAFLLHKFFWRFDAVSPVVRWCFVFFWGFLHLNYPVSSCECSREQSIFRSCAE